MRQASWCFPEAEEVEVDVDPNDLRIDVYRSSGPGGQSVNTTDSAVRITHLPTGIVVSCQNEKSQLQNREQALRILRARILASQAGGRPTREASAARRSQVRTVDRSERIRTYNFAENRISDHRVGFKAYNLDQVLDGDLSAVVDACKQGRPRGRAGGGRHMTSLATTPSAHPPGRSLRAALAVGRADSWLPPVSPRPSATPSCSPHTCWGWDGAASGATSTKPVPGGLRRPRRSPGRANSAAAPHGMGVLPHGDARRRTRRLLASPGDRGRGGTWPRPSC